jgi:hypothetical protein
MDRASWNALLLSASDKRHNVRGIDGWARLMLEGFDRDRHLLYTPPRQRDRGPQHPSYCLLCRRGMFGLWSVCPAAALSRPQLRFCGV